MFHAHSNWFFSRDKETGTVIIERKIPRASQEELNSHRVELDADAWASILAHVSARGENGQTWQEARDFHMNSGRGESE